jgi:hypothetical protein
MNLRHLLIPLLLLLPACFIDRASDDEPIYPAMLATFKPGVTTAAQVVERLGAPIQVVRLNRRSAYRFEHRMDKTAVLVLVVLILSGSDHRSDRVWAFFDENDVLTHFATSYASHRAEYSLPWEDIHDPVDERAKDEEWREEMGELAGARK